MALRFMLIAISLSFSSGSVLAQGDLGSYGQLQGQKAITFSTEVANEIGIFTNVANKVFRPKTGDGRLPAVVLAHTCGGLKNAHVKTHANEFLEAGYVVLVQDSFTPRGSEGCRQKLIPVPVAVMDAYKAREHLAALPFVDPERIYLVGYSYGGLVAHFSAAPESQKAVGSAGRFRAAVSHYGTCKTPRGMESLFRSTDKPVLVLLAEKDTEIPNAPCFPLLEEMKAAGAPVEWHIYPGATHGWDKQGEGAAGYVYNEATSKDATRRTLEFLERHR